MEARRTLATQGATLTPGAAGRAARARPTGDDVLLLLLDRYAPLWLAGLLGAGIMAAVMASDSQILALSTMFTEDVFAHYGGKARFGEAAQVQTGPRLRGGADRVRLRRGACSAPESDLRAGHPVRVLRLRGAVAAAGRGALLAGQHQVGRAGARRCGWRRRWSRWRCSRPPCRPRRRAGRSSVAACRRSTRWPARPAAPRSSASCPWCRWCWSRRC